MPNDDKQRCPSCNKASLVLDQNSGELACSTCGLVITEKGAADGPEWRSFANDGSTKVELVQVHPSQCMTWDCLR